MEYLYIMVNIVEMVDIMEMVVKMDKQGRIIIPIGIRRRLRSNIFLIKVVGDEIHLKPIEVTRLTSFIDKIEVDVDDFTDTHKLREALME